MSENRSTKTVLLIGGNGVLGAHLAYRLRAEYRVVSAALEGQLLSIPSVLSVRLNFKDENFIKALIHRTSPDFVLYLGGPHIQAWAEREPKLAELYHASGIGEILKSSELTHSKLLYLSSCHVFDGHRGNYRETDPISPFLNLGKFIASGENLVRSRASVFSILRLPPLYGRGHPFRPTFLDLLHQRLLAGRTCELQDYEFYNFASFTDATETIAALLSQGLKRATFHYGGLTKLTHYQLGTLYARALGLDEKLLGAIERPYPKSAIDRKHPLDFSMNSTEILKCYPARVRAIEETFPIPD